jgi:NADH dehydrogenase
MRILILGAGFAGVATARGLERRLRAGEAEITIVGRDNFSLFTPMLPEVSAGGLETRHVVTPVRAQLRRAQFVLGDVTAIDLDGRAVEVAHSITGAKRTLAYDQLVLALGSVTSTFGIPGVDEHALPLKTLQDAERLRDHVIATLELADVTSDPAERARLLTYAIVGGGYTGAEGAGELVDLFRSITPYYASIAPNHVRIVVIEAGAAMLAGLPPAMGRYTAKNLAARGVELHLGDAVTSLDDRAITLASGTVIPTATVIWSAGVRPTPVVRDLPLEHARNGGIVVGRDFAVPQRPGVWALGDCAWIPTKRAGEWYPMTAQHAIREGPALARNIAAALHGAPAKPFDFTALGTMASLGGRRGVASLPNGIVITGFPAWFLWRTYYLSRLPGWDRKVRVALDWALGLLFRRDIAELRWP